MIPNRALSYDPVAGQFLSSFKVFRSNTDLSGSFCHKKELATKKASSRTKLALFFKTRLLNASLIL